MNVADRAVLVAVRDDILNPELVREVIRTALGLLEPASGTDTRREILARRLNEIERELLNLAGAVARGGELDSLLAAVRDRERQRDLVRTELATLEGLSFVSQAARRDLERAFRAKLADWRALLTRHVPQARKVLQTLLVERLVFTPKADDTGDRYYEFTGRGSLESLLAGVARAKVCVSPTGFEPVFPD